MGNSCGGKAKTTAVPGSQYNIEGTTGNPDQVKYFTAGRSYENIGDFPRAIECFNLALKSNPGSAMSYTGLGHCYNKSGDYPRAIDNYNKAVALDPNNKFAYNGLGVAYEIIKNDEMAVRNFNRAIELDEGFAYPYNGLGNFYYARRNYAQAIPYYESALRLNQGNPLLIANLACAQLNNGHTDEGFHTFRSAVSAALAEGPNMTPTNRFNLTQRLTQFENSLSRADPKYMDEFKRLSAQVTQQPVNQQRVF